jgi:hypothetical protein
MHRGRPHAVARGQRRKLVWATFDQTAAALAAGAHVNVDLLADLEVAGASKLGATIIRTHLRFTVQPDTLTGGAIYGLVVARAADVGVGVGPNPISDPTIDWMLYQRWLPFTDGGQALPATSQVVIDNRSKRKIEEMGQAYLFSFANNNAVAQTPRIFARTLIALA